MSPSILTITGLRKVAFLLNSRTSLVIAPCNRRHKPTNAGIPSTEETGPICRLPWTRLNPLTWGFSPRVPVLVLGIVIQDSFTFPFHGLQASIEQLVRAAILRFSLHLIITILRRLILINISDCWCQSSPKRQKYDLRCRTYPYSKGILTFFPLQPTQFLGAVRTNLLLADLHC